MESKSKYFLEKNFVIYLLGKGFSTIFSFASIPLFIKYFGIGNFGNFTLLYTTFLMFLAGATGWINQGILRFYSLEENKESFSSEITDLTFKSASFFSILLIAVFQYNSANLISIVIAVMAFFFACFYTVFTVELQAQFKSKKVILSDIFRLILYFSIPLILYFTIPTILPEIAFFIGIAISYLGAFLMINNWKLPHIKFKIQIPLKWSIKIWHYGFPLSIWMILSPSLNTSDRYIINYFLGSIAVGQYSAIYDIVFKLFSQLAAPFNNIVQPLLINSYNSGLNKEFKKIMIRSGLYLTLMFIGLLLVVFFLKHFIVYDYLNFKGGVAVTIEKTIIPLLLSSFFWQISILLQKILEINNRTFLLVVFMAIAILTGIVIAIYFIPTYGYIASAYGMLISSIVYFLIISKTIFIK